MNFYPVENYQVQRAAVNKRLWYQYIVYICFLPHSVTDIVRVGCPESTEKVSESRTLKLCAKFCMYMNMGNFPGEIQFYQIILKKFF